MILGTIAAFNRYRKATPPARLNGSIQQCSLPKAIRTVSSNFSHSLLGFANYLTPFNSTNQLKVKKLKLPPAHSRRGRQSSPPDSLRRPAPGWRDSLAPSRCRRPLQNTQRCGRRQGRCQLQELHLRCRRNLDWKRVDVMSYPFLPVHRGLNRGSSNPYLSDVLCSK